VCVCGYNNWTRAQPPLPAQPPLYLTLTMKSCRAHPDPSFSRFFFIPFIYTPRGCNSYIFIHPHLYDDELYAVVTRVGQHSDK
jgi:hypothetical protein